MSRPFFFIISVVFGIFIYLWQQNTSIRLAYKVSTLQTDYNKINTENDLLRLKINSMLALEKMYKIAQEKNLERPDEKSIVYID